MADKEKAKNARKRKKNEKPQKSFWRNLMLIGGASLLTLIIIVMLLSNFFDTFKLFGTQRPRQQGVDTDIGSDRHGKHQHLHGEDQ